MGSEAGRRSRPGPPLPVSSCLRWRRSGRQLGREYKIDREAGAAGPGPSHQLSGGGGVGVAGSEKDR